MKPRRMKSNQVRLSKWLWLHYWGATEVVQKSGDYIGHCFFTSEYFAHGHLENISYEKAKDIITSTNQYCQKVFYIFSQ